MKKPMELCLNRGGVIIIKKVTLYHDFSESTLS